MHFIQTCSGCKYFIMQCDILAIAFESPWSTTSHPFLAGSMLLAFLMEIDEKITADVDIEGIIIAGANVSHGHTVTVLGAILVVEGVLRLENEVVRLLGAFVDIDDGITALDVGSSVAVAGLKLDIRSSVVLMKPVVEVALSIEAILVFILLLLLEVNNLLTVLVGTEVGIDTLLVFNILLVWLLEDKSLGAIFEEVPLE